MRQVQLRYQIKKEGRDLYLENVSVYYKEELLSSIEFYLAKSLANIRFGKVTTDISIEDGKAICEFIRSRGKLHFSYIEDGKEMDTAIQGPIGVESVVFEFSKEYLEIKVNQKGELPKLRYKASYKEHGVI